MWYLISMFGPAQVDPDRDEAADLREHEAYANELRSEGSLDFVGVIADPSATITIGRSDDAARSADTSRNLVGLYMVKATDEPAARALAARNPLLCQGGYLEVRRLRE